MSEERTKSQAIRIEEARDGQRPVLLHPGDDDVFVRTGKQVIEACRLGISIELWLNEFSSMLEHAQRWAQAHAQRVRACFAAPRSARVALYFVPTSDQFDFDLAEELSDLNAALVQQFNIGMVEVHQIPWGDVERFIDLRTARQIHGPRHPAAHQPVEAYRGFLATIDPAFADWIITVCFYTALHAVDALLAHDRVAGITSHEARNDVLCGRTSTSRCEDTTCRSTACREPSATSPIH